MPTFEEPTTAKFDIRYDLHGQGEPRVVLYKPGTMTNGEIVSLAEAVRRGIVSKEQAEHAREVNQRIQEATERVSKDT